MRECAILTETILLSNDSPEYSFGDHWENLEIKRYHSDHTALGISRIQMLGRKRLHQCSFRSIK